MHRRCFSSLPFYSRSTSFIPLPAVYQIVSRKMANTVNLQDLRVKYKGKNEAFTEDQIPVKEPFHQFKLWFEEVRSRQDIIEPNAMCLATTSKDGFPSARMVLLKSFGKTEGFKFFTNCASRKGNELKENPRAALTFYWAVLNRSVRIEGDVDKLSDEEATKYFLSRPYASQIGAIASNQSYPIPSREFLCQEGERLQREHPDQSSIEKPTEWGGYTVIPRCVEFWQGQTDRMHDRIKFRRLKEGEVVDSVLLHQGEDGWVYERLSP